MHYTLPGHPINTFDEEWDGELNLDYFEPFRYKSLPPKMITKLKNVDKSDPVTSLLWKKIQWQRTITNYKCIATTLKVLENYEQINEEVVQCPKHLIDIAAHLDSDPTPHFNSSYNWYYAGNGNLQTVCIDWVDYLLHSEFNKVYISEFNKNILNINPEHVAEYDCGDENNILETIISSEHITVLRTKCKIFILKLTKIDDRITFEKLKCIKSELPYTSVAFDNYHKNILYITSLDHKLSIINLDRMKARSVQLKAKLTTLTDNWNSVVSSEKLFYVHAARDSISIYDKWSNNVVQVWKNLRKITDDYSCNDISVAKHFEGTSSLYFGTDHHLFLMDLRYGPRNNSKVVQRWTHGMECVPTYLQYCKSEFCKDLICLSSQWCEDMCVVPNYNDRLIRDTNNGGVTLPYRPPNIRNTLYGARENMLCLNPYNPIDSRICTSITGNLILDQGEKYDILLQNAFGDISCHTLFPEHLETFMEDDSGESLHKWSETYQTHDNDLEVSSIENIAGVLRKLRKMPKDYRINDDFQNQKSIFNENEIVKAFEEEEIDIGLKEAWTADVNETRVNESCNNNNLYYSDDESHSNVENTEI
ncbi:uncharacterized protein LOC112046814 isoform X2 [Bicyclus anynana]|nr:uncharacterized protein LOC112046814 isoform X2 [Bicyclus anynana]